ncbi:MAG: hypothetical protein WC595_04625 [Candidatus Nanoarchaeia archaeon]
MASTLQNAIIFFRDFGLFDVVLPFLLVFAIMYALLEKTRILGFDKDAKGNEFPKHALNSTVSFVVAMLVVATNKVVTAINTALPNVVLLLVSFVSFLLLIGMFYKEGAFDFGSAEFKGWRVGFMITILAFIVLFFADAINYSGNKSWLDFFWEYLIANYSGTVVGAFVMLIIVLIAVYAITKPGKPGGSN